MLKTLVASVITGDISGIPSNALITAINSGGMWYGGIDRVIQRNAGEAFHSQAAAAMPLKDGQTVVARGESFPNKAMYENVVFVVDDLERPLNEIITAGLRAADEAGFESVSLPTIRMGVMLGTVKKTTEEAVHEMVKGLIAFQESELKSVKTITFVVYNDVVTERLLKEAIQNLNNLNT